MSHHDPIAHHSKSGNTPFAFQLMETKQDALDRLDIRFRWGNYGIRVLRCHLTSFPPGKIIPFHKHSEYEFHFIPRGKGMVILGDTPYELTEGMFYLTGPDAVHYQEADEHAAMDELCLHIDIVELPQDGASAADAEWGQHLENEEAEQCVRQLRRLPLEPTLDKYNAMQWFLYAYRAWSENQFGFYASMKQAVVQILLRAVRAYEIPLTGLQLPSRDMNRHRFQLVEQFMHDNYASPLTLEEVAEKVFVSARQLQRIFQEQANLSFSKHLENIRLAHVSHDLLNSELTVQEIALRHGFSSSNYLFSVFKKRYGMTPKQYKARQFAKLRRSALE